MQVLIADQDTKDLILCNRLRNKLYSNGNHLPDILLYLYDLTMEERQYLTTWKRYLPVIRLHIKKSLNEEQAFKLNITDFESAGGGAKSGYTFNIQMENGKVINNISGSAVARDLYEALRGDDAIKAMLQDKNVKISVGKSFMLSIKTTHLSTFK